MAREPLVTVAEAAKYLGKTPQALYAMRHKKEAPPSYRIGRRTMYRLSEIDEWLERHREQPEAA